MTCCIVGICASLQYKFKRSRIPKMIIPSFGDLPFCKMARSMSPHWRDPMHYAFLVAALTARGATMCMRHAGPGFVVLGMGALALLRWFLEA